MPTLRPLEQIDAGGVDSRSNPINMPRNRALRCINWAPKQAGFWELRYGYSTVSMSIATSAAIHSLFPYRTWDGTKYVLFMQGTLLNVLNTGTGVVTTPTVLGDPVASSAKGMGYFANNRFHYGNGTDQKWFDASVWRNNGLRSLTAAEIQNIIIVEGVREFKATEASTVTLTAPAGGTFPADNFTGHLIYVAIFDVSNNEIGPATISVGTGRVKVALNDKITVANLPDFSTLNGNWVKLIGGTADNGNVAWFFTNTSTAITSCTRSGVTVTVISPAHGLSSGNVVMLSGTTNFDAAYVITVTDVNTFLVTLSYAAGANTTGGTVKRIVKASNAQTSVDVLGPTQDTSYQMNQDRGFAASAFPTQTTNSGYQFYASIYNPNGGGHAGNRVAIGGRAWQPNYRSNWRLGNLPDLTGSDPEWTILIGRTGDGAVVPYVIADSGLNWQFAPPGEDTIVISDAGIDGQHEMPTRNGIIPSQCNMFCVAGDFCYAADTGSPFLRRSGDLSQATERGNTFVGRPEQSWAPNDIDTFPTAEACTGMFEIDQEVFMGTQHSTALSVNLAGIQQWTGPFDVGIAGRRAGTKAGTYGFFWISGDKQLCTFEQGVPIPISDEYELAELSQIGDQFLSQVEITYYRSVAIAKDELRIEGQKADGTPYTIIHDFKLRESRSAPGSFYGQGYASQFLGPLSSVFTVGQIRDSDGALQIYAGATNGQLFQLYSGADDVGSQYTADCILLLNGGPDRPDVPFLDFYGDANILITVGRNLETSLAPLAAFPFVPPNTTFSGSDPVVGSENDFRFRVSLVPPEVQRLYLRFQLTSHSADGNLDLNSPPHVPLEDYGRLYEFIPSIGDEREI
jgi:hypothetical protein